MADKDSYETIKIQHICYKTYYKNSLNIVTNWGEPNTN